MFEQILCKALKKIIPAFSTSLFFCLGRNQHPKLLLPKKQPEISSYSRYYAEQFLCENHLFSYI